jgi:hypothetical protein
MKLLFVCVILTFVVLTLQSQEPPGTKPTDKPVQDPSAKPVEGSTPTEKPVEDPAKKPTGTSGEATKAKCLAFLSYISQHLSGELTDKKTLYIAMAKDRATEEYKNRAIEHFKEVYGLDFSKKVEGADLEPLEVNPELTDIVTAAYGENIKDGVAFPTSNVKVKQDFWRIKVLDEAGIDIPTMAGKKLTPNQLATYGEFRYVDENDKEILPKIIFWNKVQLMEMENSLLPIVYELKSESLGTGLAVGAQTIREVDGKKIFVQRLISNFPATLEEIGDKVSQFADKCKDIKAKDMKMTEMKQ